MMKKKYRESGNIKRLEQRDVNREQREIKRDKEQTYREEEIRDAKRQYQMERVH